MGTRYIEPPRQGGSNELKKNQVFFSENFQFLEVKFSIYLNRCVFVMQYIVLVNLFSLQWVIKPIYAK